MGNITKAERDARAAAKATDAEVEPAVVVPVDDGLIEVRKGNESLRIHPSTVNAHADAGWVAV